VVPFAPEVKARIFIRSARICCLCYKQCGTNIEAAHIVAEAEGGGGDDENAIPLCFDCHQEIGAYDIRHPKGNRFSTNELKARRDQLYRLVESGSIQAQLVAGRVHASGRAAVQRLEPTQLDASIRDVSPQVSSEAEIVLKDVMDGRKAPELFPRKLKLLSEHDRAWVLDNLVRDSEQSVAIHAITALAQDGGQTDENRVLIEQALRRITLTGDVATKAAFMATCPIDLLTLVEEGLRTTFFLEVIDTMERDQFAEVNIITPAVVRIHDAIPDSLRTRYLTALLSQARSHAFEGAPAAQTALKKLSAEWLSPALAAVSAEYLVWFGNEHVRELLRRTEPYWPVERRPLYNDFVVLSDTKFKKKYWDSIQ